MNKISQDIQVGDTVISLETGVLAPQTNASVVARYGNTVVLATVVMGKVDESKDYFPLSVEFVDKLYAGGLIKGGKWIKREGGPTDTAILYGRIIDRSVRPLFPAGFQNEVQLVATVLSNDKEHDAVIPAFLASSAALAISDIPFSSPVSAIRVGLKNGQPIISPSLTELKDSQMDLLICVGPEGINMIEAGASIIDNATVLNGIESAYEVGQKVNQQLMEFVQKCSKKKVEFEKFAPSQELLAEVEKHLTTDIKDFLETGADGKHVADEAVIKDKITGIYQPKIDSKEINPNILMMAVDTVLKQAFRQHTLTTKIRYDKRALDEIRPLTIDVGVLPCVHGSAMFQRGLTQAITVTTLGSLAEKQFLQDSTGETTKRYIHYYSAMPFSTFQIGRFGRPGRREIGHGSLAEKALLPVIPSEEEFPYTIALTSEVLSQNGSSSMASTCGSTLSLLDAGVPIKDLVAGISIGMVSGGADDYLLLTDIAGIEDHFGDMDFKITGTKTGITAIQLDIKRAGLTLEMIKDTFVASTKARLFILDKISQVLSSPRPTLSPFAPKIRLVKLPEDKIGEVIGSGGKTIKALMAKFQVQIDIDDFGNASISSPDIDQVNAAAYEIESMIKDVQIGEEYDGIVTRVENYGAFIEFLPGREALLHVSEMAQGFISDPSAIIKIGDRLKVKISGFNDNHQIKLAAPEFKNTHQGEERSPGPPSRTGFGGGNRNFGRFNSDLRSSRPRR
ncbi:MAG: polyribonucleotide nucleotidyltransferase [Candidatus Shapirobacteria bacterium]|jgi:polyribonucleotide nucleotidyltransferase